MLMAPSKGDYLVVVIAMAVYFPVHNRWRCHTQSAHFVTVYEPTASDAKQKFKTTKNKENNKENHAPHIHM